MTKTLVTYEFIQMNMNNEQCESYSSTTETARLFIISPYFVCVPLFSHNSKHELYMKATGFPATFLLSIVNFDITVGTCNQMAW